MKTLVEILDNNHEYGRMILSLEEDIEECRKHLIAPCDFCVYSGHPFKTGSCSDSGCRDSDFDNFKERRDDNNSL
jgi:hypothetical protein